MTNLHFPHRISRQLPDPTRRSHTNTYKKAPTNKDSKPCTTMLDIVYEENNADVMTNGSMVSSSTQATQSSACLAEKLKKLMQAPAMTEAMDLEEEERQKCARTPQIGADRVLTPRGQPGRALHQNSKNREMTKHLLLMSKQKLCFQHNM